MDEESQVLVQRLKAKLSEDASLVDEVSVLAEELRKKHPNDAWLCAELGGVFDSSGYEFLACQWYERAIGNGVENFPPESAADFFVWYGSTLRNVGRFEDSERELRSALQRWPKHSALQFFWALSLMSLGSYKASIVALAELQTGDWDDTIGNYRRAVSSYLEVELRPMVDRPNG